MNWIWSTEDKEFQNHEEYSSQSPY